MSDTSTMFGTFDEETDRLGFNERVKWDGGPTWWGQADPSLTRR